MDATIEVLDVSMEFRLVYERNMTLKESVVRRLRARRNRVELFRALENLSFRVGHGEALGVIGHNGSGKTTLLRLLAGVLTPTAGTVTVNGRVTTLIDLGAGFNPDLSGVENVFLAGALFGFSRRQMEAKLPRIVEFAELERFIDVPVKNYSSGMSARLGFSIATDVDPDVLLVDEVLAVGDESFQAKCFERMRRFREQGKTIVLVSHDLTTIRKFCGRAILMDHGHLILDGHPDRAVETYLARAAQEPAER